MRDLRVAPDQSIFNGRSIRVTHSNDFVFAGPWYRLAQKKYPDGFYPSVGSRFTPLSRHFPCIYLGVTLETTVAEVYGDRWAKVQAAGKPIVHVARSIANEYEYLRVDALPSALKICDLTDADTRIAVGIDSSTEYSVDLANTQAWAECIARHPAQFDGIYYRSRHTDELCLALWKRPGSTRNLSAELKVTTDGEFVYSVSAYSLAKKMGLRLAFD